MTASVVADSSALVAALCDSGADGAWAASELGSGELAAPQLLMFEATNTLRRLEMGGAIGSRESAAAFAELNALHLYLWPFSALSQRIWELRLSVTSYDAAYVALAELLDAPLVTLDQRLARANGPRCAILVPE